MFTLRVFLTVFSVVIAQLGKQRKRNQTIVMYNQEECFLLSIHKTITPLVQQQISF